MMILTKKVDSMDLTKRLIVGGFSLALMLAHTSLAADDPKAPSDEATKAAEAEKAYAQGVGLLEKMQAKEAVTSFRRALEAVPNNVKYRHGLAIALVKSEQPVEALKEIRIALRRAPKSEVVSRVFSSIWMLFDREGLFNVSVRKSTIERELGKPDGIVGAEPQSQLIYGFMALNFSNGRLFSVLDMRNLPKDGANPVAVVELELERGVWLPGHRLINRSQSNVEHTQNGESVQEWTKMFSQQRLILAAQRTTAKQVMENIRAQLTKLDKDVEFTVQRETEKDVIFEWKLKGRGSGPGQHEMARVIQGRRDIHRIAYVERVESIDEQTHALWSKRLRAAKLVPTPSGAANSKPIGMAANLKLVSRTMVTLQLKLIKEGNADALRPFFTKRLHPMITAQAVAEAAKSLKKITADELVHDVQLIDKSTAKIKMKNGRTLTTLIQTNGKWVADTIWFR